MDQKSDIFKAAAVSINSKGEVLLSKDRGSTKWQVLGGKVEQGESHIETIKREMKEELDTEVEVNPKMYAESPNFPAANAPGKTVKLYYYFCKFLSNPKFIENVEELHWFSKEEIESGNFEFAKSTQDFLLPKLIEDNLLSRG